jgi:hypothetical protein
MYGFWVLVAPTAPSESMPAPGSLLHSTASDKAPIFRGIHGPPSESVALAGHTPRAHAPGMFAVSEAEAAAIRAAFEQRGEFAAAVELRHLFPGITDNAQARECVRAIAAWEPLPVKPRLAKPPAKGR